MRSPSLLSSLALHGAVVAAMAWWIPLQPSGMPGEGGSTAEFNALLLDASNESAAEIPASDPSLPVPEDPESQLEPRVVDVVGPAVLTSQSAAVFPAPAVGIFDLTPTDSGAKSPRVSNRVRRSNGGLAGSRSGGGGGNGSYTPPRYQRCPAPGYPPAAREAHQSGLAVLLVSVNADGSVIRVKLTRSTGSPTLDQAALAAVRAWRFIPAQLDRTPVPAEVEVPVRFVL